ncbi:MAG: thioredoxin domain-containing protein [Sphingomonadales bacterium]|nr:thioredoxin domain-containing protein [Sphingomonadales bacterium]
MTTSTLRRLILSAGIIPLALGLAACKKDAGTANAPSGAPIAKIAPPAGKAWADVVTVTPEGGYQMGNPQAPIKVIEFGALSCSHCAEFSEKSSAEMRDNFVASGRVSYELRFILNNALDVPADLLATCGAPETVLPLSDQFWAWQKTMFENIKTAGDAKFSAVNQLPREKQAAAMAQLTGMDQFFAARGIARDQAAMCLADTAKAEKLVKQASDYAATYKIEGTPTFYVNGAKVDFNTWEMLKPQLEKLGAR